MESAAARPASSIVSSRMTDIASEDGPADSKTSLKPTPASHHTASFNTNRVSQTATSNAPGARVSRNSRSHVPSLTSNAFFRPMSSQKLQAQRAAITKPPTATLSPTPTQPENFDDNMTDAGATVIDDGTGGKQPSTSPYVHSEQQTKQAAEQETLDRLTGKSGSSHGHFPNNSGSDSVRPLYVAGTRVNSHGHIVPETHNQERNVRPSGEKRRSFRSSFQLPGRDQNSNRRHIEGAEKLSSSASSPHLRPVDSQTHAKMSEKSDGKKLGRNYEYFDGNTVFCFGGRWQNTSHRPVNIATGGFIIIPCALFFAFDAPWLWYNISPALPIVFAYLAFICFSSFVHASVSDPGILPRNLHQFPPTDFSEDPLRIGPPTTDWTLVKSKDAAAMEVPMKYCKTCNIWRQPRTHHCRLCDNCIETHDHHCVWLNNCVGKRNYRYFFTFISSACLLSLFLIGASIAQIIIYMKNEGISFGAAIDHFRGPFALVILGFVAFLYPASLLGYHIFLMARGETTREFMYSRKFSRAERFRPYDLGSFIKNIAAVLLRPRSPSYYQFKNKYSNGDQRLGTHRNADMDHGLEMSPVQAGAPGFQGPVALRSENAQQ